MKTVKRTEKDFSAPSAKGLGGAARRAAMTLVLMLLTTTTAWAQEHSGTTTDGLTWELTQDAGGNYTVLTIGGSGAMKNYGYTTVNSIWKTNAPWGYDITSVTIGDGVTSIGDFAFIGCENLASVTIGSSVESIGIGAINHCDQMTTVTLPASVTSIGYGAFENCQQLTRVNINHDGEVSLTGSLNSAFNAPNLQYIVFPSPSAVLANTKTEGNWARYSDYLRAKLGNYLFRATNDEEGTSAYAITSSGDLQNLATHVNTTNNCMGKRFKQTADITLSGTWTPIGKIDGATYYFKGTYDGGGFNINGLSTNTGEYRGLFGVIGLYGVVKNVNVVDCTVIGRRYVGGIAGYNTGGTIDNCTVSGTVSPNITSTDKEFFGGICGYSKKTIKNCTNFATISNTTSIPSTNSGGIAGYNAGSIQDCFTVGTIDISDNGSTNIGMVVGRNTAQGTISGTYYYAGTCGYDAVGSNLNTTEGSINVTRLYNYTSIDELNYVGTTFNIGSQTYGTGYFAIADEQDLIDLANYVSGGSDHGCEGVTFKMTADLDFSEISHTAVNNTYGKGNFMPIGMLSNRFLGHFDGQGHTITGLYFSAGAYSAGLFGDVNSPAVIENVTLVGPELKSSSTVGGIIGWMMGGDGTATVSNCAVVNGKLVAQTYCGGIVGDAWTNSVIITGCTIVSTSVSGKKNAGIVIGDETGNSLNISDCTYHNPDGLAVLASGSYTDDGGNVQVYRLTASDDITVTGTPALTLGGKAYYANGTAVTLGYSGTMRDGYDLGYTVNSTAIDGSEFNMPASDVTVGIEWTPSETVALTANLADGNCWTTFYCGDAGYDITTDDACAYTAKYTYDSDTGTATLTLHRLGTAIAKGEAVIIVSKASPVSLTKGADGTVSSTNDLHGVDVRTLTSTLGTGTFYVMGKKGDDFGFFEYTGDYMPARKAYLLINGSHEALARGLTMVFEDVTGIKEVKEVNEVIGVNDDAWYTLDGRRLQARPTKAGLYIHGNRKVMVI